MAFRNVTADSAKRLSVHPPEIDLELALISDAKAYGSVFKIPN